MSLFEKSVTSFSPKITSNVSGMDALSLIFTNCQYLVLFWIKHTHTHTHTHVTFDDKSESPG